MLVFPVCRFLGTYLYDGALRLKMPGKLRSPEKTLYEQEIKLCCLQLLEFWAYLLSQHNLICPNTVLNRVYDRVNTKKLIVFKVGNLHSLDLYPGKYLLMGPQPSPTQEYFLILIVGKLP